MYCDSKFRFDEEDNGSNSQHYKDMKPIRMGENIEFRFFYSIDSPDGRVVDFETAVVSSSQPIEIHPCQTVLSFDLKDITFFL